MILPDHRLKELGPELIDPFKPENVQPASIDLTLADDFLIPQTYPGHAIDLANVVQTMMDSMPWIGPIILQPQEFILGSTLERINVPDYLVGRIEGKSSLGRLGLLIHSTAGYADPGFQGRITLEFYNLSATPIILQPGKRICQIAFEQMLEAADRPYGHKALGSKYQGQDKTTASRYKG